MDWSEITGLNVRRMQRVVALLLALANLAEGLSLRSHAVRQAVLWLLRPGEAIAGDYIADVTGRPCLPSSCAATIVQAGDGVEDAMRLARSFRALAAILLTFLEMIAAEALPGPSREPSAKIRLHRRFVPSTPAFRLVPVAFHDTS